MKRVLFVAYGAGHIRTILPVVKALSSHPLGRAQVEPLIVGLTTARSEVENAGFNCLGFRDLVVPGADDQALQWGRSLVGPPIHDGPVPDSESVAYMGLSYRDLVVQAGEKAAQEQFSEYGRACFTPVFTAARALENLGIDAVVSTNSPRAEKAFLQAARDASLPSLAIWPSLASHELEWIGQAGFTSKVCVDSDYSKNQLVIAGRSPDEIALTGNPQFDGLLQAANNHKAAEFRRQKGWHSNDRVLLFANQLEPDRHPFTGQTGDPTLPDRLTEELVNAAKTHSGTVKLCVRNHPNQAAPKVEADERISLSTQADDLADLLPAVDAVFTCSSTLGYQAALIGKPVVQGMFSMFSRDVPFAALVGAREITDMDEFGRMFADLHNDQLPPSIVTQANGTRSAALNVLDVLEDLLA
ncbi:MAG: hypothetical protein GY952_18525 [Rhodobacteraceae bacterium]|nr:hypothetical protein [Paracoccaceae bacterium]